MVVGYGKQRRPDGRSARTRRIGPTGALRLARRILSEVNASPPLPGHPDLELIRACVDYAALRARSVRRATPSPRPQRRDNASSNEDPHRRGSRIMRGIAGRRAVTAEGQRARAAAFVLWDDGDLTGRARGRVVLEDVLLAAMVLDLLESTPRSK